MTLLTDGDTSNRKYRYCTLKLYLNMLSACGRREACGELRESRKAGEPESSLDGQQGELSAPYCQLPGCQVLRGVRKSAQEQVGGVRCDVQSCMHPFILLKMHAHAHK